jgi:hypothetical protein
MHLLFFLLQVRHATIERSSQEAIDAIHRLQPTSMSWSNVADYMVMKVRQRKRDRDQAVCATAEHDSARLSNSERGCV